MYPGFATQYLRQMKDFRLRDYEVAARPTRDALEHPGSGVT